MDDTLAFLRNISFLRILTDDDVMKIHAACEETRYEADTIIFTEGAAGDCVYIIAEGEVEIWKGADSDQPDSLAVLRPGDMFGEIALIDDQPRSATAVAVTNVRLLTISQSAFADFINQNQSISFSIMRAISSTLRKSNDHYIDRLRLKKQHLEAANQALQAEIAQHRETEAELIKYRDHLEKLVDERTAALTETNRRLTQEIEERIRSEEKYRLLVENASDAIFIQQNNTIKFANTETGNTASRLGIDIAHQSFLAFIHPDDRDKILDRLEEIEKAHSPIQALTFRLINAEEQVKWVEVNVAPITWEDQPATLNFLRDITLHKKMEEEFHKSQRMEALGTLAGGIAHNFNNLLQVIQGNVSFIMLDKDPGYQYYSEMQSIAQSVENGANLTRQLLGFARTGQYLVKPVNINDVINNTAQMFARTCQHLKIHKYFQKNIWTVEVDHGQLELVLLNLFINARQAMQEFGDLYLQTENVLLKTDKADAFGVARGRYVCVSITDTGIGMDENVRAKIFEPFFSTKAEGEGTGLGLASAYGIIKRHGGFINVESEKARGTTFQVYLAASNKEYSSPQARSENLVAGSETIMLVDDEDTVVRIGELMLKEMGYQVLVARGGRMAVEKFREYADAIDMVILDFIMPDMDGGRVCEQLKAIRPGVKILLSSGYRLEEASASLLERGCDGFINKPFDMTRLSEKVRRILDQ